MPILVGLGMKNFGVPTYSIAIWHFIAILVYFLTIWYVCGLFGTFSPILVSCTKKNLATFFAIGANGNNFY
jgi:hypothetical protein